MTTSVEVLATVLFALAIAHTFLTSIFKGWAHRYPKGSVAESSLHLLGEVEVVFGLWSAILLLGMVFLNGKAAAVHYLDSRNFSEPIFVFAVLACCSTRAILTLAERALILVARILPLNPQKSRYWVCLVLGPLLGSFVTEPAAMAVTALVMKHFFFDRAPSNTFKYLTLGVLFVNVSVGGVLTPYAAPPVLMVAGTWGWDLPFMMGTFGWKAILICILNASIALLILRKDLAKLSEAPLTARRLPWWMAVIHLFFLAAIVIVHRHPTLVMGLFLFLLGFHSITKANQDELHLRESLLVSFFLAGLVVLGGLQSWWLQPLLAGLSPLSLFMGTTALTALTDNAALTYLGAQVPNLTETFKYLLVAGAVAGGGLTVIANAPNPAGFAILQSSFGDEGIHPLRLLLGALLPTCIAVASFWFL